MLSRELLAMYTTMYCLHSFTDLLFLVTPQCSQSTSVAIPMPAKVLWPEEDFKPASSSKLEQEYIEVVDLYVV
jgi:hypothetical protein